MLKFVNGWQDGNSDVCQASPALKSLRKDADIYDDWVYMGRQPYVTTTERRNFPRYPGMYFDALGRIYFGDKPPDRYYYYIDGNKIYKPRTVEEYSEFEVWVKTAKDFEGNAMQIFLMRDEPANIIRDSSVYHNGNWTVFEFKFMSGETHLKTSWGMEVFNKYDSEGRLTASYFTDEHGNTSHLNPEFNAYGYIPNETALYPLAKSSESLNILKKSNVRCSGLREDSDMPEAYCIRYTRQDIGTSNDVILKGCYEGKNYCPGIGVHATFGEAYAEPSGEFECECDPIDGRYYTSYKADEILTNKFIRVMESNWKYDPARDDWDERCWSKRDMQLTYEHEVKHIKNGFEYVDSLYKTFIGMPSDKKNSAYTKEQCLIDGRYEIRYIMGKWEDWFKLELKHDNKLPYFPQSPTPTDQNRSPIKCPK